jgi:hypothetical protein
VTCEVVKIGGMTAIVCGRPRRTKKCVKCGINAGTRLCDWKIGKKNAASSNGGTVQIDATCDKPICGHHTFSPAKDKDLCPEHAEAFRAWQARKQVGP